MADEDTLVRIARLEEQGKAARESQLAIAAAQNQALAAHVALTGQRFESRDQQLVIADTETLRRLEALNHENARLAVMKESFVPQPLFEANIRELRIAVAAIEERARVGGTEFAVANARLATLDTGQTWLTRLFVTVLVTAVVGAAITLFRASAPPTQTETTLTNPAGARAARGPMR